MLMPVKYTCSKTQPFVLMKSAWRLTLPAVMLEQIAWLQHVQTLV